MKNLKFALTSILALAFVAAPLMAAPVNRQDPQTQPQATSIMRGYRTGYSDGYQAGVNDLAVKAARDFRNKVEYEKGDRAYNANYGAIEDYRDGYQQGFEVGYNAGFDRKPFDQAVLHRSPYFSRRSIFLPVSARSVWSIGASAVTLIVSVMFPGCSARSTRTVVFTTTSTPARAARLKPVTSAVTV